MRVWVTRAEPEARRTAERLIAAGHRPLVAPLLGVVPLKAADALAKGLNGAGALAFTSANGVRAFAELRPLSDRGLQVFTVGQATAAAARLAGFERIEAADGDSRALAALIGKHASTLAGLVLHAGPLEPAGDLVGELGRKGVSARAVAVYDTRPLPASPEVLAALDANPPALDAALVYSAKAAHALAEALAGRDRAARALECVCISKQAAAPLKGLKLKRRVVAEKPNETAMIARLGG